MQPIASDTLIFKHMLEKTANFTKERYKRTRFSANLSIRPKFKRFQKRTTTESCNSPIHQHDNYELILVEKGGYRCRLNGKDIEIENNKILVFKPGDLHQEQSKVEQQHFLIEFRLASSPDIEGAAYSLFEESSSPEEQISTTEFDDEIQFVMQGLALEADEKLPFSASVQDALLEVMFWRIVRGLPEESLSPPFRHLTKDQTFTERFNRIVKENLGENLKMEEIASLLNISKRTLNTKCSLLIGSSPAQAYLRLKMDAAITMLINTDMAVKEVSYELGYRNQYHFSRVFKRYTSQSPSEYRMTALIAV